MGDWGRVSIVMPCYRAADTLERSISGILHQTYPNWELWLMLDGADESTLSLARSLSEGDARFHVVVSQKNRGVSRSRNLGMRLSNSDWIAFCDADDFWLPQKLELQLGALVSQGGSLVCSAFAFFDPITGAKLPVQTRSHIDARVLLQTNPIPLSTAVFDRRVQQGVYFPEMPKSLIHEDYAFWLQMFQRHRVKAVYLKTVTTEITQQSGSRSSNKWLAMRSHGYILRKVGQVNGLRWYGLMVSYLWHGSLKRVLGKWIHKG